MPEGYDLLLSHIRALISPALPFKQSKLFKQSTTNKWHRAHIKIKDIGTLQLANEIPEFLQSFKFDNLITSISICNYILFVCFYLPDSSSGIQEFVYDDSRN